MSFMGMFDQRIDYETAGMERADIDDDPIVQWQRWYDQAVEAELPDPTNFCVATVDGDGMPDNRWVLVRGVDHRGFSFFTNLGSAKSQQLAAQPKACGVFAWLPLHRQVRVRGAVEPVSADEADAYYASRPRASQIGAWASPQSSVIADRSVLDERVAHFTAEFEASQPSRPPYWGGWRVVPTEIEFWQGRPSRLHDRFVYRRIAPDQPWTIDRLAP
jgi:pyridoxamine 5'-phosphate oxidase